MGLKRKVLLLGNIKEDGSKSMQVYLENLLRKMKDVDYMSPTTKLKPVFYKLFIYPWTIPRKYGLYHILDHSYGNLIFSLPKKRTIITCHDLIPLVFPKKLSLFGRLAFKFYLAGLKRADKIIADSQNTKNDLVRLAGIDPTKIEVIYMGLAKENFKKIYKDYARINCGFARNEKIILSIGGFFYKNTSLNLKVLKKLVTTNKNFRLVKVGKFTSEEESFIENNKLEKFVYRKDKLTFRELNNIYCAVDILSFPSLYEGFGWPPLEAMACGTPVIASNVSSLPEIVGDAAVQINPSSTEELEEAIRKILIDRKFRESLINRGYKNIQKFSWDSYAVKLNRVYESILKK